MQLELLIIDPQNDFCDPNGSLFVPGANQDIERLAQLIQRLSKKIDDIHVTLDTHHLVDIAHPIFWVNSEGNNPNPFTIIEVDDLKNGVWRTSNPQFLKRASEYVEKLAQNGRYPLCIWPPHCLIGSPGHNVYPVLYKELLDWENTIAMVDYVTKGSNFWTEHYSAVQADVPDPNDPDTMLNTRLIETLERADIIILAGEARSHCLANTVNDIADSFGEENIKKMVLMEDATSDVPGFEDLGKAFIDNMVKRGMQISNTIDFLK